MTTVKTPSLFSGLVQLARPRHWIKNVFVLLPLPFAVKASSGLAAVSGAQSAADFNAVGFLYGLFGFCLLNSAVYTFNDLLDAQGDRHHPQKRFRPIAAGVVPVWAAVVETLALCSAGFLLMALSHRGSAVVIALTYLGINIAYSLGAKHVALVDVFLLSSGFVLRVLLGCTLVAAVPSSWLLLCTSALALFLGFAKRRADIREGLDHKHRPSLRGYSQAFLDQAMAICAGVAVVSYALYCIEAKILLGGREMASIPFVVFGILNYLRMADVEGAGGSPVDIAFRSLPMQLCGLGWLVAVTWSLGMW